MIRLVLADDHPIMLKGLSDLFRAEADCRIVARCSDGEQTLEAVRRHQPSVLVLDLRMPRKDGLAVLREMRESALPTRVVLLTAALDETEVAEAVRLGARAVVLKEAAPQLLVKSVRTVHAGGVCLDERWLDLALEPRRESGRRRLEEALTARELEIVRLATAGVRNRDIAARLAITEGTVKIHLHHIYSKLEVDGRMELMLLMQDRG